jgi:hypothetical protein
VTDAGGTTATTTITVTVANTAVPAAPSTLVATAASSTRVSLTWRDNAGNESGFAIFRATGGGNTFVQIATVGANVTAFADTTVRPATSYKYRVRAFNGAGASSFSNTANVRTPR